MRKHSVRRLVTLLATVAIISTLFGTGLAPADAADRAPAVPPTGLAPKGSTLGANPQFTWDPLAVAEQYRIQIASDPSFGTTLFNTTTYNTTYSPPTELPVGTIHWRVAGIESGGVGPYAAATFTKELAGPNLIAPVDGSTVDFPTEPPTFSWERLSAAKSYILEVDDGDDFIGATAYKTANSSFTLTEPQAVGQTFFWRVRGASGANGTGVLTDWSLTRELDFAWPAVPGLISPPDNTVTPITDVRLEWSPVLGADSYELEVNRNVDFTGSMVVDTVVYSTVYSPPVTLENGSYHWRVRAKDVDNNLGPWSESSPLNPFSFTRGWASIPTQVAPLDAGTVPDPMTFEWSTISRASHYEIEIDDDPNMNSTVRCATIHTTLNPVSGGAGSPGGCSSSFFALNYGQTYYWRVRGIDATSEVIGLWSPIRSVQRTSETPAYVGPSDGAAVATPVLDWMPVEGAEQYRVVVYDNAASQVLNVTTFATSYTPQALDPADGPFRWYVVIRGIDGREGVIPNEVSWRDFTLVAPTTGLSPDPLTPADGASNSEMPSMTWTPVTNATRYEVWLSVVGSGVEFEMSEDFNPQMAGWTQPDLTLPEGAYTWRVKAFNGNVNIATGPSRAFTRTGLLVPELTGPDPNFVTPAHCPPGGGCATLTSSPVFDWEPVQGAGRYVISLAYDANFTNIERTWTVGFSEFIPREELPDNDAGQAYYWHVQPCRSASGGCTLNPIGRPAESSAFQKRSVPVSVVTPADGGSQPNQPSFTWTDYVTTQPSVGARNYRIQIATDPVFTSVVHDKTVDQNFYAVYDETFDEGPLYWHVAAIDQSGNQLTWSTTRLMTKTSPPPIIALPDGGPPDGAHLDGVPTFRWRPQAFASEYVLEVYKNGDLAFSPSNRVINVTTANSEHTPSGAMAAGAYSWRVRREDGQGRDGPWTVGRLVTIDQIAPTLVSPGDTVTIIDDDLVFAWNDLEGAVSYRFQRSNSPTFSSTTENLTTIMTSWAPTAKVADGTWYWRVLALNAADVVIGTSVHRTFVKNTADLASAPSLTVTPSAGRLTVSWGIPADPGVPAFTEYMVTLNPGNVIRTVPSTTRSITFNGLINGNIYDVIVRAKSSAGLGDPTGKSGTPNGCTGTPFSDVGRLDAFCDEIAWLNTEGISNGTVLGDGRVLYKPTEAVARQAMAAFLYRFAGEPVVTLPAQFFDDVPPTHPFYEPIQWMAQSGLSFGTPQPGDLPLYRPGEAVSRQAMAAFLYRFAQTPVVTLTENFFVDVTSVHVFYTPIQWMAESDLSKGTEQPVGKPKYKPTDAVSRQAMAAFLFRFDQWLAEP